MPFGGIGWGEVLLILLIILLLFGAKRIPEVMNSFGKGIKEFKKGMSDIQSEIDKPTKQIEDKDDTKGDLAG
jgi:sec-independent protein translocase protein TatA